MEESDPVKRSRQLQDTQLSATWRLISLPGHQMAVREHFDELSKTNES